MEAVGSVFCVVLMVEGDEWRAAVAAIITLPL